MSDPHPQGGDLFDMAKDGTKVPADAAKPNYIKSEANPEQKKDSSGLESAALNEVPLGSTRLGEVVSASGGELPEDIGEKYSMHGGKERPGGHAPHSARNQPTHG
ncbi:hypothetical protein V8F20_001679 [Naviculisporaceae sp. PSN 640]